MIRLLKLGTLNQIERIRVRCAFCHAIIINKAYLLTYLLTDDLTKIQFFIARPH